METFTEWFVRTRGHAWPVDPGTAAKASDVHITMAQAVADWCDEVQKVAAEAAGRWA